MVRELCFFFFFLILSFDLCGAFFSVLCTILDLDAFYMNYELLDLPLANFQYGFIWLCLMRISCEEELSTAIYLFFCVFHRTICFSNVTFSYHTFQSVALYYWHFASFFITIHETESHCSTNSHKMGDFDLCYRIVIRF